VLNLAMGLPARLFYIVMRLSPPIFRSRMWMWLYQRMARSQTNYEFRFMNYGFKDDDEIALSDNDEPDRLFIQLYHMNIRGVEIEGREVLEVGSGRGGGASWIAKTLKPKSLIAVDYSSEAVRLCQTWYNNQKNLTFLEGNAENLAVKDESFDVVYNVESSHCYANMEKFLSQVLRVLRPGGDFCWTDMRETKAMQELENLFSNVGFQIRSSSDVTENVLDALKLIEEGRREIIRQSAPQSLRKSFETFGGVPGTPIYEAMKAGRVRYLKYHMVKPWTH
tara:strand:+ start:173 stop:1009 length:837 start_codon:yes stop_codon:yes gene_type:complete